MKNAQFRKMNNDAEKVIKNEEERAAEGEESRRGRRI